MSLGYSLTPASLASVGNWLPWQFRSRPSLVLAVGSVVSVLLIVGLLLVARRLTGALVTDLPGEAMLLMAVGAAAMLTFSRIAWRRRFPLESAADLSFADQLLGWSSSAALALLAIGCCYPANRTGDWLIWLPILVADQLWRQSFFDAGEPWVPDCDDSHNHDAPLPTLSRRVSADAPQLDDIVQQLYRVRDEQAGEVIYGTVRADFVTGQRTAVVHVGFCPPFAQLPDIEAEVLPGFSAKIKVAQAFAHGTRLDVRLSTPTEAPCQVWLDLAARPVTTTGAVARIA